jgi:hypothetical protein
MLGIIICEIRTLLADKLQELSDRYEADEAAKIYNNTSLSLKLINDVCLSKSDKKLKLTFSATKKNDLLQARIANLDMLFTEYEKNNDHITGAITRYINSSTTHCPLFNIFCGNCAWNKEEEDRTTEGFCKQDKHFRLAKLELEDIY